MLTGTARDHEPAATIIYYFVHLVHLVLDLDRRLARPVSAQRFRRRVLYLLHHVAKVGDLHRTSIIVLPPSCRRTRRTLPAFLGAGHPRSAATRTSGARRTGPA